ncbi:MAG: nucleotidyl transferase AbiEii/AbiGii toxin family protein [Clostridia bacterium]|nr:nucleotidyl transferase AbiEii/AbiGii toxin family protein [Clostridia bacterium]
MMKLHLDKYAFDTIISNISKRSNIRRDILEKDYYITLILNELTSRDNQGYAYFKGGTALYKGLKSIKSFSEDIDLTVNVSGCSNSQMKKRLNDSTRYNSLSLDKELSNKKGSIVVQYTYESLYNVDVGDALQRFGKLKIESTNFGIPEPTSIVSIAPHLYELASKEEKDILESQYEIRPFNIITLSLERIFMDKLFAAEHYYRVNKLFDLSKHLYDLSVLLKNENITNLLKSKDELHKILNIQLAEEGNRYGGISNFKTFSDLTFMNSLNNVDIEKNYNQMLSIYIFNAFDNVNYSDILDNIFKLKTMLSNK